jgi:VIT1/CCC1 family predicted Fe2+/Mn2+ transporter
LTHVKVLDLLRWLTSGMTHETSFLAAAMAPDQTMPPSLDGARPLDAAHSQECTGPVPAPDTGEGLSTRLNALRAGVMGANDGIVSTAGIVVGVAGAAVSDGALLAAGVAGVAAGALSMAVGEYVSVSSQRDSQRAVLVRQQAQLNADPTGELHKLAGAVAQEGVEPEVACQVSQQLTGTDATRTHARLRLGIDPDELSNPWHAGLASMLAFLAGALIPLAAILLSPREAAVPITVTAVTLALLITGVTSAQLGGAPKLRAALRNVAGGALAMAITYVIGALIGTQF